MLTYNINGKNVTAKGSTYLKEDKIKENHQKTSTESEDLLSTPGAGGLQCHLEMNLLRLKGNLSSPPERGGEGEKVEAAGAGQVR